MSKKIVLLPLAVLGVISLVLGPVTQQVFSSTERLFIVNVNESDENAKEMELKATKENGETTREDDFEITLDNVISIEQNGKLRVFAPDNGVSFTKARTITTTVKISIYRQVVRYHLLVIAQVFIL